MEKRNKKRKLIIFISTVLIVGIFVLSLIFVITSKNRDVSITLYTPITNNKKIVKVNKGSTIDEYLITEELTGYEFVGWYYDSDLTLRVEKGSRFNKDHTIYAGYSKILNKEDESFYNFLKKQEIKNFITIRTQNDTYLSEEELNYISTLNLSYINLENASLQNDVIKENYFSNNLRLEKIKLSDSIKEIKENSFYNCINLKTIELKNGILHIEDNAFYNCLLLENLNIPNSVISLGDSVFYGCKKINEFNIPDSLEVINDKTFFNSYIEKIFINENYNFKVDNNCLYTGDYKNLIFVFGKDKDLVINENTVKINKFASYGNKNIEKLTLNETIQEIGENSFKDCKNLKNIEFKDCIDYTIKESAFEGCGSLSDLTFSLGLRQIEDKAFKNCVNIKNVIFNLAVGSNNKNIEKIGNSCFENCKRLEKFDFPNSVIELGYKSFYGCSSLKEVNLSSSIKHLKEKTFSLCFGLEKIALPVVNQLEVLENYLFEGCGNLINIENFSNILEIGYGAFKNCTSLESVELNNVEYLNEYVFYNCLNLVSVNFNNLKRINSNAFANCSSLSEFKIYSNLEEIDNFAFNNCLNLQAFVLIENNDYFSVYNGILYNKEKSVLKFYPRKRTEKEFNIIKELEQIEDFNFFYNEYIENFTIEEENQNFSVIDGNLYNKDSSKLIKYANAKTQESVNINVNEIGKLAFANNKYIKTLQISSNYLNKGCFVDMKLLETLITPFLGYKLNSVENKFLAYFFNADSYLGYTCIPDTLESVKVTDDLEIYEYAFYNARNLKTIEYDKATIVNKYAFYECEKLTDIIINISVERFCEYSIYKLKSLNSITFGFNMSLIVEKNAFGQIETSKVYVYLSNNGYLLQDNQINFIKEKVYTVYNNAKRWVWGNK